MAKPIAYHRNVIGQKLERCVKRGVVQKKTQHCALHQNPGAPHARVVGPAHTRLTQARYFRATCQVCHSSCPSADAPLQCVPLLHCRTRHCVVSRRTLTSDRPSLLQPSLQPCPQGRAETLGHHVVPQECRSRLLTAVWFFFFIVAVHEGGRSKPGLLVGAFGLMVPPSGGAHSPALTRSIASCIRKSNKQEDHERAR